MVNSKGFATFLSDDLPGFDSLNGSGFFDDNDYDDWDQISGKSSSDEEVEGDSFNRGRVSDADDDDDDVGLEVFRVIRDHRNDTKKDDVNFFETHNVDDDDDCMAADFSDTFNAFSITSSTFSNDALKVLRNSDCRRRKSEASTKSRRSEGDLDQGRPRRVRSDGTKMIVRDDAKSSMESRPTTSRRNHRGSMKDTSLKDGSSSSLYRHRRSSTDRPNQRKSSRNSLGLQLEKLSENRRPVPISNASVGGESERRRMKGRQSSARDTTCDDVSVGAGSVQTSASNIGCRRGDRRRRATENRDLLARSLQHYDKKSITPFHQSTRRMDKSSLISNSGSSTRLDPVWKQRRRRNDEATAAAAIRPAIAA